MTDDLTAAAVLDDVTDIAGLVMRTAGALEVGGVVPAAQSPADVGRNTRALRLVRELRAFAADYLEGRVSPGP